MRGDETTTERAFRNQGFQGGGEKEGRLAGIIFILLASPPALGTNHTNKWRVPEALLAMVKGGWREWRPPVGECLARSPGPWSNVPRACCSTGLGDAARSRAWATLRLAEKGRTAHGATMRALDGWADGQDRGRRWTVDEEWHHHAARLPSGRLFGLSVLAGLPPSLPFSGSLGTGRRRPERLLNFANTGLDRRDHRALGFEGGPSAPRRRWGQQRVRALLTATFHIPPTSPGFLISRCPLLHSAARLNVCFEPRRRAES